MSEMIYRTHPLDTVWCRMRERCYRAADVSYHRYGGRGVRVCDQWLKAPRVFIDWAIANGWKRGLQIDRIDNDGDYCPENCRFVSRRENMRNTSRNRLLTHNGQTMTITDWAEVTGIPMSTIRKRIVSHGWSAEKALTTPAGAHTDRSITANGKTMSVADWSAATGIPATAIYNRLRRHWTPEESISTPPRKKAGGVSSLK